MLANSGAEMMAIVLVDNEPMILELIVRLLSGIQNVRILVAKFGQEAIALCRQQEIALVLADNRMQDMHGLQLFEELEKIVPDTVKVLVTSDLNPTAAMATINRIENCKLLYKPWKNTDLTDVVKQGLLHYRMAKAGRQSSRYVLRTIVKVIELKDPYTRGHSERVARYALQIADSLRLNRYERELLTTGCWLHDCGKIAVPLSILHSPHAMTDSEFTLVKKHATWGAEITEQAGQCQEIVSIVRHHHEAYGGKGYPDGLAGDKIPLLARIVCVADVFDALTSKRPYRPACTLHDTVEIMKKMRGQQLDPKLADLFFRIVAATETKPFLHRETKVRHSCSAFA